MKNRLFLSLSIIASLIMYFSTFANAYPVDPCIVDTPEQDPLVYCPPCCPIYDELGNKPPFPNDEWITSSWEETTLTACSAYPYDDPLIPNVLVTMTNMTSTVWGNVCDGKKCNVYYVADPETNLSNWDGLMGCPSCSLQKAFIIDSLVSNPTGVNNPLIYESMGRNDIFEVGETWQFIIQDYTNSLGIAPSLFQSLGIAGCSGGDLYSSGSIVGNVPEPATMILLAAGLLGIRRMKK